MFISINKATFTTKYTHTHHKIWSICWSILPVWNVGF